MPISAASLAKPDTWRLAQGHTFQLLPGRVQRLPPMNLTAEELATLPPSGPERLTAARELHAKKHAQG